MYLFMLMFILDCPTPWLSNADHCYKFDSFPTSISDAKSNCAVSNHWGLVVIHLQSCMIIWFTFTFCSIYCVFRARVYDKIKIYWTSSLFKMFHFCNFIIALIQGHLILLILYSSYCFDWRKMNEILGVLVCCEYCVTFNWLFTRWFILSYKTLPFGCKCQTLLDSSF